MCHSKKEHLKEMMKDLIGARIGGEKEKLERGDLRRTRSSFFCSFMWADSYLTMSAHENALGADDEGADRRGR